MENKKPDLAVVPEENPDGEKAVQLSPEKTTLLKAIGEMNLITQEIIANGGELTPAMEEAMNEKDIVIAGKIDSYAYIWERSEIEEAYWKQKADEFSRVANALRAIRENLKFRLTYGIKAMGKTEVVGREFIFKFAKTSGKLIILDEKAIPRKFKKTVKVVELDKAGIKAALTAKKKVKGAKLIMEPSLRKLVNKKGLN